MYMCCSCRNVQICSGGLKNCYLNVHLSLQGLDQGVGHQVVADATSGVDLMIQLWPKLQLNVKKVACKLLHVNYLK
jgi:hypothetical protein